MYKRNPGIKSLRLISILSLMPLLTMAQADTTAVNKSPFSKVPDIFFEPSTYLWILIGGIVFGVFIALTRSVKVLADMVNEKTRGSEEVISQEAKPAKVTAWSKWMNALTRSVPVEQEADVMLDHDYDGIRELDNKLPPWWVWGFYITIFFAFIYLINYHVSGSGKLQIAEYKAEMRAAEIEKENRIKNDANFVTEANVARLTDPADLDAGKGIFTKNCVACHGNAGQGGVGPNLTDVFWLHGGGIKNIFRVITEGVPAKGMISWKAQLSPKQIQSVASYIMTLEGTNPPDPKAPQGDKWEESVKDSVAVPADSSKLAIVK